MSLLVALNHLLGRFDLLFIIPDVHLDCDSSFIESRLLPLVVAVSRVGHGLLRDGLFFDILQVDGVKTIFNLAMFGVLCILPLHGLRVGPDTLLGGLPERARPLVPLLHVGQFLSQ